MSNASSLVAAEDLTGGPHLRSAMFAGLPRVSVTDGTYPPRKFICVRVNVETGVLMMQPHVCSILRRVSGCAVAPLGPGSAIHIRGLAASQAHACTINTPKLRSFNYGHARWRQLGNPSELLNRHRRGLQRDRHRTATPKRSETGHYDEWPV